MQAFTSKYLFDGNVIFKDKTVVVEDGVIVAITTAPYELTSGKVEPAGHTYCGHGILTPGFIDLQLNGCGGVSFNADISESTLETMYQTCRKFGTTGFLPTLITCEFADVIKALNVIQKWFKKHSNNRGVLGIHLEGPFISRSKCGIHPTKYIIQPTHELLERIVSYSKFFPIKMTIAVEEFTPAQIKFLIDHGIVLAIGHSNASYAVAMESIKLGVKATTHTFNAMSGLTARAPGVIGAALYSDIYTGLIADLVHVDAANIKLLNKTKADKIYLVTDSVTPTGTDMVEFDFADKALYVKDGKCVDANGVLGGANLTMNQAIANCVKHCGIDLEHALKMASQIPARLMGIDKKIGRIEPEYRADLVYMDMKTFKCEIVN